MRGEVNHRKRKGLLCVFLVLILLGGLSDGCSTGSVRETTAGTQTGSSGEEVAAGTQAEVTQEEAGEEAPDTGELLDLTQLSSTVVYAEVYHMMVIPEDYEGKTVRMRGQFVVSEADPEADYGTDYYFAVLIADATACCQQGLEFILADESILFPIDYPELGSEITVTGEFHTYQEGDDTYCHLTDAVLE